jgi:8-oxo-dGTP pyrophosphatase MutT (NUDIX family)
MRILNIPEGFAADEARIGGLERAIASYGPPERHHLVLDVSADTLAYWGWQRRKRLAEVVLALRRPDGGYLLHTKAFYPPGAYRLLSGGLKLDEDALVGARREAAEETGLPVEIERFLAILSFEFRHREGVERFTSLLFALSAGEGPLASQDPGEQITAFRAVPVEALESVADALESLPPAWLDWGRFRASPHRLVARLLAAPLTKEQP